MKYRLEIHGDIELGDEDDGLEKLFKSGLPGESFVLVRKAFQEMEEVAVNITVHLVSLN